MIEGEAIGAVKVGDEFVGIMGRSGHLHAIDRQEGVRRGKGGSFVAIEERMVLRQALLERCGLADDVVVIACLRTKRGRL